jgi:predicted amidohydrolase
MPVKPLPNYEVVPLRNENTVVAVAQTTYRSIDASDAKKEIRKNLDHMLAFIDKVQARRLRDLIVFHEFPLQGSDIRWTRDEQMAVAIEVPGEETELIGRKAKQYNCYIEFGSRALLKDWPGHFVYMGLIIGPDGNIVLKRWKARNMAGIGYGTTMYDVLDQYVEMYGWDAVFPIARTDIGNLAIIPEIWEPEMARAYAIKGAEMIIRYMTYGSGHWSTNPLVYRGTEFNTMHVDFQSSCMQNNIYGVFVNNAVIEKDLFTEYGSGSSAIFDMDGKPMAMARGVNETMFEAVIPMAEFRKTHSIPRYPKALYEHLLDEYEAKFPPNLFVENRPQSNAESIELYDKNANW